MEQKAEFKNKYMSSTERVKLLTSIWFHISAMRDAEDIESQSLEHPCSNYYPLVLRLKLSPCVCSCRDGFVTIFWKIFLLAF